jgi:hypothetical protein
MKLWLPSGHAQLPLQSRKRYANQKCRHNGQANKNATPFIRYGFGVVNMAKPFDWLTEKVRSARLMLVQFLPRSVAMAENQLADPPRSQPPCS